MKKTILILAFAFSTAIAFAQENKQVMKQGDGLIYTGIGLLLGVAISLFIIYRVRYNNEKRLKNNKPLVIKFIHDKEASSEVNFACYMHDFAIQEKFASEVKEEVKDFFEKHFDNLKKNYKKQTKQPLSIHSSDAGLKRAIFTWH